MLRIFFVVMIMIMNLNLSGSDKKPLRLTNGEWPPYHSQKLKNGGIVSHIVTDIFASKGVKVEYGWFPWSRAMKLPETGEWDGCVSWATLTEKQQKKLYFSDPIYEGEWVFFHLKTQIFDWKKLEDLYGMKLGLTIGYEDSYGKDFIKALTEKKIITDYARSDELNFKKLIAKRFQIFLLDKEVGYDMIRTMLKKGELTKKEANSITHHPLPFLSLKQHLILSKKIPSNKQILKLFNEGLKEFKANGKIKEYFTNNKNGWYDNKIRSEISEKESTNERLDNKQE